MAQLKMIQAACAQMGVWAIIGTCFCIPLSTSLMDLCSVLVVLFWLLSGKALSPPPPAQDSTGDQSCLLVFSCFFSSAFSISPADPAYSFAVLMKYRELLLLPIAASLIIDDD